MTKILIVTAVSEIATGGGQHVYHLIEGMRRLGGDVAGVCLERGTLHEALCARGTTVHLMPVRGKADLSSLNRLRGLFAREQPSVVHSHGERGMFFGNWAACSAGVPVIMTTVHRSLARTTTYARVVRKVYTVFEDLTLRNTCTLVVAVSGAMRQELIGRGLDPRKVAIVHNGVEVPTVEDAARIKAQAQDLRGHLGLGTSDYIVGSVGRLVAEKGYFLLIKAAAAVLREDDRVVFLLVGDGSQRKALRELCESYGISERVRFVGHQRDIRPWLGLFDQFVLPSPWESFGLSIAEALSFGLPVVAVGVSGPAEILVHRESGLLVPAADPDLLAEAIIEVRRDPGLARRLGANGRATVGERFTADRMVDETLKLYDRALGLGG